MSKHQSTELRILHFDDEPTPVRWLSDALVEHLLTQFPGGVSVQQDEADDDSIQSTFELEWPRAGAGNLKVRIEYTLKSTPDDFKQKYGDARPDIVVLDVLGEDQKRAGVQLFKWLKDKKSGRSVRIMFLTGYRDELEEFIDDQQVSNDDVFSKAPSLVQFIGRLTTHLESSLKDAG